MDTKKFNIFSMFMVAVMCFVAIFVSLKAGNAEDGRNGKSSYELAIENGLFKGTEYEYLLSLQGKDGSDVTVEDLYNTYLAANELSKDEFSLAQFIETFYPKYLLDTDDASKMTLSELASQQALRSTVDILYSGYMNTAIINATPASLKDTGEEVYVVEQTTSAPICLSAGSGVIYKITDDVAYIITNYHVAYVANYSNDPNYRVYYNSSTSEYFTATFDESKVKPAVQGNLHFGSVATKYIKKSDIQSAPLDTHFMQNYEIYLHGYQTEDYALSATFVGGSADNDIAVLKIEKSANPNNELIFTEDYTTAAIGDSGELNIGEDVIAVGNPLLANTTNIDTTKITTVSDYVEAYKATYVDALCLTVTGGEVSNISEYQDFSSIVDSSKITNMRLIRVSSAINAGNSGGGLYDIHGRLIGIVNGKIASADYDNVGYAIPINKATIIADKIIAECSGINGSVSFKGVTEEKLKLHVETSKNGTQKPYYDEATLSWVNKNSVIVKDVSTSTLFAGKTNVGDTLVSITIDGKTYKLAHDYDLYDNLLRVSTPSGEDKVAIIFNFEKIDNGQLASYQVEIQLSATDFEVIA